MALTLEVIHHKGIPSVNPLRARFGQGGGTVGRSLDNNLALPDEDKIISRYHGKIRYQNGEFVYIDTSTGGTLLCNKNRLLEKEDSVVLADGDHLKIGEYELVVRIEPEEQPFPGLFPDLGAQQPFPDINRVESGLGVNVQPLFGDSEFTPVLGQNMPPLRPAMQNDSFINQPDVSPFQQSFTPPDIQKLPEDFSFDGVLQGGYSSDQSVSANKNDFAFPDDWFGNLGTDAEMLDSTPDQAPSPFRSAPQIPPKEAVVPEHQPRAALGDGNANLFDGDGLEPSSFSLNWAVGDGSSSFDVPQGEIDKTISVGGKSSAVNVQSPPPFPGNASILAAIPADGTHALSGGSERLGDFQESLPPFAKGGQGGLKAETSTEGSQSPLTPLLQRGELVESFLEIALHSDNPAGIGFDENNTGLESLAATPAQAINIPKPGGQPILSAKVASTVSPTADPSLQPKPLPTPRLSEAAPGVDLFKCFLEGAGLVESLGDMKPEEQMKAMKSVGRVYREMVDGMMKVLLARKMEKSMIALHQSDVTQFRRGEYNPLKIFPTAEETMEEMMRQKNPAYIGPDEAVKEGFADIMNHQMAMRAGMQAAMGGFLKSVDPKTFEEMFKDGIIFQKKAKCWDAYGKAYPKLVEQAMDDLFGETFAEAYRGQLRILRQSKQS